MGKTEKKVDTKRHQNDTVFGDIINCLCMVISVIFVLLILAQHDGKINIFSDSFVKDGFCVANQDKSVYMQSHAMCFYADTAYAIVLWIMTSLCVSNMEEASYNPIKAQIMGIFGHGCGHLYLAFKPITVETSYQKNGDDPAAHAKTFGVLFFFWYTLTMSVAQGPLGKVGHFCLALLYNLCHYFVVPGTIAFAYVSAVLIVTYTLS